MEHRHDFKVFQEHAVGLWSKRECPGDKTYFAGTAVRCDCGMTRFVPDDSRLQTVDAQEMKQ